MYVATFLFEFNGRSGLILELDLVRVFCEDYRGVIELPKDSKTPINPLYDCILSTGFLRLIIFFIISV